MTEYETLGMRTIVERTYRCKSGADLLAGVLAMFLGIAVWVGIEAAAATRAMPLEMGVIRGLGVPLATFVSVPVLVGIYARVGRDEAEDGIKADSNRIAGVPDGRLYETAQLTVSTLRSRGSTLLAGLGIALLASLVVGLLATLVLHAVVLTALTIAGYTAYALGHGQLVSAVRMFHISGVLVGLGLLIGMLSVRFFDCVICWTDAGPLTAVRESLRFTRNQPLTVVGYVLVTTVLFAIPSTTVFLVAELHEMLALGILLIVTSASFAVYANFHAQVCYRKLLPVCCGTELVEEPSPNNPSESHPPVPTHAIQNRPLVDNPLALTLAFLLVTALLVGSGSVRALDVRPVDTPDEPGAIDEFDDAATLVGPDAMPQTEVNYQSVETGYKYNESQDQWVKTSQWEYEIDHQQRRSILWLTTYDDGEITSATKGYFSTKQWAMQWHDAHDPEPPSEPADRAWGERTAGNWFVYSVSGYELIDGETGPVSVTPEFFEQEWELIDKSTDTITLAVDGRDAVPIREESYGSLEAAEVEVTLDRETGYVVEMSQDLHREDGTPEPLRTHIEFENWDDHDVDRPADIDVQAVEWIWGVASY